MDAVTRGPAVFRSNSRTPAAGLVGEAIDEAWSRRRLIRYLVQANLRRKGSDTLLGNLWWILDPLLLMAVYVILISVIFQRGGPDYPLFIFSAILPWKWFASSVGDSIVSVTGVERLIKQLAFPKIVLPLAANVAGLVSAAFGLIPLAVLLLLLYAHRASPTLLLIPAIAVVQFVFTLAFGLVVAAVNVFYRDVANVSRHFLRLWFYLSPALYSLGQVRDATDDPLVITLLRVNPFTTLFEAYRAVIYDGLPPDWPSLIALLLVSTGLLAVATWVFKRLEPSFAKIL